MTRRGKNNNAKILKTFKDYLIPIVIVVFVLLFVIKGLFTGTTSKEQPDVLSKLSISLDTPDTEGYIEYTGGRKAKISGEVELYKTEKVQVVNNGVKISGEGADFHLNRLGELRYNENGSFTHYSSDLWGEITTPTLIEMRYAKVNSSAGSVFSLSQNEVASSIYVLKGNVEVSNLSGNSTLLKKGEKLVIMRNNSNDKDFDLDFAKELIDDYVKGEEWFEKNNAQYYLSLEEQDENNGSNQDEKNHQQPLITTGLISFSSVFDEKDVGASKVDISGHIDDERVYTIEINGKNAEINLEEKKFTLTGVDTQAKVNDIVYKIYDSNSTLLYKGVLTLHNASGGGNSGNSTSGGGLAQVENFPIGNSPLYEILSPKQNPYITSENVVRIEGTTPPRAVTRVIVNGFQLQKYIPNGTYWQYFANSEFGNLLPGVNLYKIEFYNGEEKVYETTYTIIKQE